MMSWWADWHGWHMGLKSQPLAVTCQLIGVSQSLADNGTMESETTNNSTTGIVV